MTLLLMAGGRGSRYGKLKQFDTLGDSGEFLMEFGMYDALEYGFDHIVVVTQEENVTFLTNYLSGKLPKNIKLDVISQRIADIPNNCSFSGEREKPWGTAHAVWSARNVINNSFAVINADDFYGKSAYEKAAGFIRNNSGNHLFALMGYTLKDTLSEHGSVSRGICEMDSDHNLLSIDERLRIERQGKTIKDLDSGRVFNGDELASMNFWVCKPSIFDDIETALRVFMNNGNTILDGEIYLPLVIQELLKKHKVGVRVIPSGGEWFGVTYASDKEKAIARLKEMSIQGAYKSPLWQ